MDFSSADFGFVLALTHATFIDELSRHMLDQGYDGYTTRHGAVLRVLGDDSLSLAELAALHGISAPGMHKLVSTMTRQGYLESRPAADDRRKRLLFASAQGHGALAQARSFHASFEADLVDQLGADVVQGARRVLTHVAERGGHLVPSRLRPAGGG